jgi:hypothetical protein
MSNANGDWYDPETKNGAVYKLLDYLATHPQDGLACVGKDEAARTLFEAQGGITVPVDKGARVIFFAPGERAKQAGSSVILEIPPAPLINATDDQLKAFILGNYEWWRPQH